ncbi:hypothetical protein PDESU_06191 [Pontiella desulfatans]|uniref:Uncharacterized protein n=1 Tax=Pontiella desulfatans TaxID=2750659 RepID=A0A6C2UCL6_PONDE|nr:hypothetical protein [Pontiella desulfatans]VGO17593.1 hypothetical protein PDESU_06191 [Pontiella desulfatans]
MSDKAAISKSELQDVLRGMLAVVSKYQSRKILDMDKIGTMDEDSLKTEIKRVLNMGCGLYLDTRQAVNSLPIKFAENYAGKALLDYGLVDSVFFNSVRGEYWVRGGRGSWIMCDRRDLETYLIGRGVPVEPLSEFGGRNLVEMIAFWLAYDSREEPPVDPDLLIMACGNCQSFCEGGEGVVDGYCRRVAPVAWLKDESGIGGESKDLDKAAIWPVVECDHYCGQFSPKKI